MIDAKAPGFKSSRGWSASAGGLGNQAAKFLVEPADLARLDRCAAVIKKAAHGAGVVGAEASAFRERVIHARLGRKTAHSSFGVGEQGAGDVQGKRSSQCRSASGRAGESNSFSV